MSPPPVIWLPGTETANHFNSRIFNTNVKPIICVSQVVAKGMIASGKGGSIVNISSQASQRALKEHTLYCATKGAMDAMTRVMALELGPQKVSLVELCTASSGPVVPLN
jgi:L-xylulose reductase